MRPVSVTAAGVAVLVLAACGHGGPNRTVPLPGGASANTADLTRAVGALCDAVDQAQHDPTAAGSAFYLRSHTELHTLASALGLSQRARSARLLQDMYAVEQDIAAHPPPPGLATDLATLTTQTGGDLTALGLTAPSCTSRTQP
ncbi:MAG: hypothetical protein ACYDD7_10680 [Acidimicrobiales bacterium]